MRLDEAHLSITLLDFPIEKTGPKCQQKMILIGFLPGCWIVDRRSDPLIFVFQLYWVTEEEEQEEQEEELGYWSGPLHLNISFSKSSGVYDTFGVLKKQ